MSKIFKVVCKDTGMAYIGVSKRPFDVAVSELLRAFSKTMNQDSLFYRDIKKYGKSSFTGELLTEVERNGDAKEVADQYIEKFGTLEPSGYNRCFLGIRKIRPDYYKQKENKKIEIKENMSGADKIIANQNMIDEYGIENLSKPTFNNEAATQRTIRGLRQLADDLERYGNRDIFSVVPNKLNESMDKNWKDIQKILKQKENINPDKEYIILPKDTYYCVKCGRYLSRSRFFENIDKAATNSGLIHFCKGCLSDYAEKIYEYCKNPVYTILSLCQIMNIAFFQVYAEKAVSDWSEAKGTVADLPTAYITYVARAIRSPLVKIPMTDIEFRNSNFEGDIFGYEYHRPEMPRVFFRELNKDIVEKRLRQDKDIAQTMEQKWGKGFKAQEYVAMEEEYLKLEKFLPKKTELHYEALKKYVIYNFKEKQALADGKDLKEVKEWSALADKAADNAQLKIKQLSADFGEGVDSFAQLAETVEEYYSAIPTLPKARKMPYDDMDFIIWQVVNYIRRLEGKPETTYEEVYHFYDEELTKKMRDAGMSDDQIQQAKDERNAVFKDLTDAYQEPLWLLPTMNEDEQDDDEGGDL